MFWGFDWAAPGEQEKWLGRVWLQLGVRSEAEALVVLAGEFTDWAGLGNPQVVRRKD